MKINKNMKFLEKKELVTIVFPLKEKYKKNIDKIRTQYTQKFVFFMICKNIHIIEKFHNKRKFTKKE